MPVGLTPAPPSPGLEQWSSLSLAAEAPGGTGSPRRERFLLCQLTVLPFCPLPHPAFWKLVYSPIKETPAWLTTEMPADRPRRAPSLLQPSLFPPREPFRTKSLLTRRLFLLWHSSRVLCVPRIDLWTLSWPHWVIKQSFKSMEYSMHTKDFVFHTHTYTHIHIHIYLSVFVCVYV